MSSGRRSLNRQSMETGEDTLKDIWQLSQAQKEFDPGALQDEVDKKRQTRQARGKDRLSFGLVGESPMVREETRSRSLRRMSGKQPNVNLQRSLQLLDEAVGTPGPLLRSGRKTPLRHSNYTPRQMPSASKFDVSATLGNSVLATPGSTAGSTLGESGINASFPHTPVHRSGLMETSTSTPSMLAGSMLASYGGGGGDVTTTNVALLLEDDPGLTASAALYGEFMDSLKSNAAENQVFDLLGDYERIVTDQVSLLKKLVKRATPGQNKFVKTVYVLKLLEQEKDTWRLLHTLYMDRLETELGQDEEAMMIDDLGKHVSEKQTVDQLYTGDSSLRQSQLVIDWLEKTAAEELDDYYNKVEYFSDQSGAWENTLHHLQQKSGGVPLGLERPLVDELDPDAPIRQGRPLADLDREDEARLAQYMFACIRAGQLDEAQRLCNRCGQAWRAATLEGWRLYHDPNYESLGEGGEVLPVEGNPYRDIWKAVCWRMAQEKHFSVFERAVYATFSGNLGELLPACQSWEDYLWAYFRVLVDKNVEREIRMNAPLERTLEELPSTYWDKMLSMDDVFREIQACSNDDVRHQSKEAYRIIQRYIILEDIDGLIEQMYNWLKDDNNKPALHLIRFMAHMVLFLRTIGRATKDTLCNAVLECYVRELILEKQKTLVATFVATLPRDMQVEWYARFLEGITEKEERQRCLALAEEAGLDIPCITKAVVINIRNKDLGEFSIDTETALEAATSQEDRQKIEAIDWLVFDPSQRAEAMRQANAVMRGFLALKKHAACREVFNKIPAGSIDIIIRECKMQSGSTELEPEDDNAIREYLCIKAYLDAHDSFNDWFAHYHHSKPRGPEIPHASNFTERVAFEHKQKQFELELERWQHSLLLQTKTTMDKIYNVLLFVNGGWMVDQRHEGEDADDVRSHQMSLLRQLCLPTMCFLLHSVLHTTEQYKACLQLADTIAAEQHQLYKVFRKDELQKFLKKLRESAIELLNKNVGPLGYPLS